jgi:protein-S-isoprenylcysteine O-methyltransferase Ste14
MQPPKSKASDENNRIRRGVRLWGRKQVIGLILMVVILFSSAGRLDWLRGWSLVVMMAIFILGHAFILIRKCPALLAERARPPEGAKRWDVWLTSAALIWMPIVTWMIAGLDFRWGWTAPYPAWLVAASVVGWILGCTLVVWAMASNPFFSAVVRIQEDRGHRVVSCGPYRYVRHPGYLGVIPSSLMGAVLLNSFWALIPSAITAVLLIIRTALEDRTLQVELDGYREYAARIRYRLIPGLWRTESFAGPLRAALC